jgi:16S rRNA (guanine966-N2)-methyltransferase
MRITGGAHRSRPLRAPKGDATRPTSDRVREALFAILESSLDGARVLDLYAGTGALGLEALSRGARAATLVESSRSALVAISANVTALRLEGQVRVVPGAVERSAGALSTGGPYDLVLADPPYALVASGAAVDAIVHLVERGILAPGGTLVLEHGKGDATPSIRGLSLSQTRRYGDTVLAFYAALAASSAEGAPRA